MRAASVGRSVYLPRTYALSPMGELVNIDEWGLSEADLPRLSNVAAVQIQLKYPDYRPLVQLPPRQRIREIHRQLRQNHQRLLALLPAVAVEAPGSPRRPQSVKTRLPLAELTQLLRQEFIGSVTIEAVEGMEPLPQPDRPFFWCVEARFAIQIENETKGLQAYEDRMLIIMAGSEGQAKAKLATSFAAYAKPYLNPAGLLVRWQFEAFLDVYRAETDSLSGFASDQGVEVFSRLRRRRLRPEAEWHPDYQTPTTGP